MENNNNEPIVLGTLKKEKSSKPVFVFIVLGILIASVFAIPYVEDYLQDPNTLIEIGRASCRERV